MRWFGRPQLDPLPVAQAVDMLRHVSIRHGSGYGSSQTVKAAEEHLLMLLRMYGIPISYKKQSP